MQNLKDNLFDMHTHMDSRVIDASEVSMLCNVSSVEEYNLFESWNKKRPQDIYSIGVHPWDADKITFSSLQNYIENASCIGEIGLDNVWCTVDIDIQKKVFREQLAFALEINKPVILHTKGMEERIAEIIKEYPNTYIVHWFDNPSCLDKYIDLDCYFTIGPAVLMNNSIQEIALRISENRTLIETDGLGAMEWLFDKELNVDDYIELIEDTYSFIAKSKQLSLDEFKHQVYINRKRALSL